eukprot:TRINITY_DN10960_c0_g1_i1.p1 TRINITY_DN10960_c0_g1~~TRINITY_DN10960_c0_g1_i1.p1  ORF type:complete len:2522 (+),score=580.89 TRINITY_DN10960_c0_g1_i1:533-7567(+)
MQHVKVFALLQIMSGRLRVATVPQLPLAAALPRLAGIPEACIAELRSLLLGRYRTLSRMFEQSSTGKDSKTLDLLPHDLQADFEHALAVLGVQDDVEEATAVLFAACDARQDNALDQEELQYALAIAAPRPASLARLRAAALLHFGSWGKAFSAAGINPEDNVTPASFVALGAVLDISYEDALASFDVLVPSGGQVCFRQILQRLSVDGLGFDLQELALRVWLAGDSLAEAVAKLQHSTNMDVSLSVEAFCFSVCGVPLSVDATGSMQAPGKLPLPVKKTVAPASALKSSPAFSEGEAQAAYSILKRKYQSVSAAAVRAELGINFSFSDVLAMDRSSASVGETVVLRYRLSREQQNLLGEHPFIAAVPSSMTWMSGGGGSWMINRQTVTDLVGPKLFLKRKSEGVFQVQLSTISGVVDDGRVDFRIFSSPDGATIGRQVGNSARLEVRPLAPQRLMVEADSLRPTSLRLLWDSPRPFKIGRGEGMHPNFLVRGRPVGLEVEKRSDGAASSDAWCHQQQCLSKLHLQEVSGLLPGVRYRFEVHTLGESRPEPQHPSSSRSPIPSPQTTPQSSPRLSVANGASAVSLPSEPAESVASAFVEVTMPLRSTPSRPSKPHLIQRGLGGDLTLRWLSHQPDGQGMDEEKLLQGADSDIDSAKKEALDYQIFWTVPSSEDETTASLTAEMVQVHVTAKTDGSPDACPDCGNIFLEDSRFCRQCGKKRAAAEEPEARGQKVQLCKVWPCPSACWFRKLSGGVTECILRPQAPKDLRVAAEEAQFCIRALDSLTGEKSPLSDLGPLVALTSPGEAALRDVEAAQRLGEVALKAGGLAQFLDEAEDAGLVGSSIGDATDLRRQLFKRVEEAGGLNSMVQHLEGLSMASFGQATKVVRAIQRHSITSDLSEQNAAAWEEVAQLVADAGGAEELTKGFDGVDMQELVGQGQRLTQIGLVSRKKSRLSSASSGVTGKSQAEDVDSENNSRLKAVLFDEDADTNLLALLEKVAESVQGTKLAKRQVPDLAGAVGVMARSKGSGGTLTSWAGMVDVAAKDGGPAVVQPLLEKLGGQCKELLPVLRTADLDASELIEFLSSAGAAEFLGPGCDTKLRQDFFARLADAGGSTVFFSALNGVDLEALRPAMRLARSTGLHKSSCLQEVAGVGSRADAWYNLAEIIEKKWGGPQAFLEKSGRLIEQDKASASAEKQQSAFDSLVEQCGGRAATSQLLNDLASAGGAQRTLKMLGSVNLQQVARFVESLRKGGGRFEDLEKLIYIANQAGGLSTFLRALDCVQDKSHICQIIAYADTFFRRGVVSEERLVDHREPERHADILSKVLHEFTSAGFLQAFDQVKLRSVATLVPFLVSAGLLRSRGQHRTDEEVLHAGEALLRWIARAGGAFVLGSLLVRLEPKCFAPLIEVMMRTNLDKTSKRQLEKVGNWFAALVNAVCALHRLKAADIGERWERQKDLSKERKFSGSNAAEMLEFSGLPENTAGGADAGGGHAKPRSKGRGHQLALPETLAPQEAREAEKLLEELLALAELCGAGGVARLAQLLRRVETLERLEKGLDLLAAARLLKSREQSHEGDPPQAEFAAFEPWMKLVALVHSLGGTTAFCHRAKALDMQHFDACMEVLSAAGLGRGSLASSTPDFDDESAVPSESSPLAYITSWREVVTMVAQNGGPTVFLDSLRGIDVADFLRTVGLLRLAGLARFVEEGQEDGESAVSDCSTRPIFCYGDGGAAADSRVRNSMLQDFVERVLQAGGFHAFWHDLRDIDLSRLKGDLHCLKVIRRKLHELIDEDTQDMWSVIHDPDRLEDMLDSQLAGRREEGDDLTLRQRQLLVKRCEEVGGVESFLETFHKVNLAFLARQHRALEDAGINSVSVIEALARIGWLVNHEPEHLDGLRGVAETLMRWGAIHHAGEEPSRLWQTLHQQVAWLLAAIEENGTLLKEAAQHGGCSSGGLAPATGSRAKATAAKEPELTPARLAQFLQALRPMGGVSGFLAAFRGLDFATAAAQARVLHDSSVRTVETARRLAGVYRLLRFDVSQLRGLEHFLRGFGGPVFAEAQTQGGATQDRLRVAEHWQRLTTYLAAAAGRPPKQASGSAVTDALELAPACSGPDQALDVLLVGLRMCDAAGLGVTTEEWAQLCHEIRESHAGGSRNTGLRGVLSRLRGTAGASRSKGAGMQHSQSAAGRPCSADERSSWSTSNGCRQECRHCGARLDDRKPLRQGRLGGSLPPAQRSAVLPPCAEDVGTLRLDEEMAERAEDVKSGGSASSASADETLPWTAPKEPPTRRMRPESASRTRSVPSGPASGVLQPLQTCHGLRSASSSVPGWAPTLVQAGCYPTGLGSKA